MKSSRFILLLLLFYSFGCATPKRSANRSYKSVEEKYSHILGVDKEDIANRKLYVFVDEWVGTPYKYAGKTRNGVDCSGFASVLYKEIYEKTISGSSASIYKQCKPVAKADLKEGDLIFFKIESKEVSHVGVYLQNNKFIHASSKRGVTINDLDEEYYVKYFFSGGKIE